IVPGADDVIAVETAFAERTPHVIARVRDRAEALVAVGNRERPPGGGDAAQRRGRELVDAADIDPVLFARHGALPDVLVVSIDQRNAMLTASSAASRKASADASRLAAARIRLARRVAAADAWWCCSRPR